MARNVGVKLCVIILALDDSTISGECGAVVRFSQASSLQTLELGFRNCVDSLWQTTRLLDEIF
jgi:hypothetical protein